MAIVREIEPWDEILAEGREDERLEADLRAAGLVLDQFLTDDDELFALSLIGAGPTR